jgi:hypothetical protein
MPLFRSLALALDQFVVRAGLAVMGGIGHDRRGITRPSGFELLGGHGPQPLLDVTPVGHGHDEIEGRVPVHMVDQFHGQVFIVGGHQYARSDGIEDAGGQLQEIGCGLVDRACGGADRATEGLLCITIQTEKHLHRFGGLGAFIHLPQADVPAGVAARPMGVDEQEFFHIIPRNAADLAQGHLELPGLRDRVAVEQVVHRRIRGQEGKSVEHLETAEGDTSAFAEAPQAQGRFVNQLQGQSRLDPVAGLSRPPAQQIPGAQTEVFRNQQPQARRGITDLVGESLSYPAFDAERIAVRLPNDTPGDLGLDLFGGHAWSAFVEFFFGGRIRR